MTFHAKKPLVDLHGTLDQNCRKIDTFVNFSIVLLKQEMRHFYREDKIIKYRQI